MNERIRELFQEAIDYADKTHTYTPEEGFNIQVWDKIRFEKFAELIVREVLDQVDEFSRLTKAYQKQGIDPEIDVTKEVLKNFEFTRFPKS